MGYISDGSPAWTVDDGDVRWWMFNATSVVVYDSENDSAWLGCEDAPYLINYR